MISRWLELYPKWWVATLFIVEVILCSIFTTSIPPTVGKGSAKQVSTLTFKSICDQEEMKWKSNWIVYLGVKAWLYVGNWVCALDNELFPPPPNFFYLHTRFLYNENGNIENPGCACEIQGMRRVLLLIFFSLSTVTSYLVRKIYFDIQGMREKGCKKKSNLI
jgi:hypothetical protein